MIILRSLLALHPPKFDGHLMKFGSHPVLFVGHAMKFSGHPMVFGGYPKKFGVILLCLVVIV